MVLRYDLVVSLQSNTLAIKSRVLPHCVVAKVQDWDVRVSEFDLHSRYYVYFQTKTLWKCIELHNPLAIG